MLAGRIVAVKNASNYDNNSDQNQRVMRPQRGPEHLASFTNRSVSMTKTWSRRFELSIMQRTLTQINLQLTGHKRAFFIRNDSHGDRGVINQIFRNLDYDLSPFAQTNSLKSYKSSNKGHAQDTADKSSRQAPSCRPLFKICSDSR